MALVEFATALAWVQFAQDKQRARLANTVSIRFAFYVFKCFLFLQESPDGYYFGL